MKGADHIVRALQQEFGVTPGQTTPDGRFTLSTVRCLGPCGMAPVLVLDGTVHGNETRESALAVARAALRAATEAVD